MLQTSVEIITTEGKELLNDVTLFIENNYVIIPINKSCKSKTNKDLANICSNLDANLINIQGKFLNLKFNDLDYNYLNFCSEPNGEYSFEEFKNLNVTIKVKNMKDYEELVKENECKKNCLDNTITFLIFIKNEI